MIRIENLGKCYKQYNRGRDRLLEWVLGAGKRRHGQQWVLRGISFDVAPGEAVGVIGQNGAGKSTLLKLLTGVVQPSEGSVTIDGRVAAILELGLGFHPEFSGRQNAYMAGRLLGMSTAFLDAHMDEIEAFAEIGAYMDEPVRTYSSGMQVRLAFSVATALRPDVLIIDEALSVGDAYFAHKSFARIREFRKQGTTLLFVSHDPGAVKTLCDRAILLDKGLLIKSGPPDVVLDYYNATIAVREAEQKIVQAETERGGAETRSGDRRVVIESVKLYNHAGEARAVQVGDAVRLEILLAANEAVEDPTVGMVIKDRLGNEIYGTNSYYQEAAPGSMAAGEKKIFRFAFKMNLGVGNYSVSVAAHQGRDHLEGNHDWWDRALVFQVIPGREKTFVGVCHLDVTTEVLAGK